VTEQRADGGLIVRAPNHLGELVLALPALAHAARAEAVAGRRLWIQLVAWLEPVLEMAGIDAEVLLLDDRRAVFRAARQVARTGARRGILLTPSTSSALIFRLAGLTMRRGTGGWRSPLLSDVVDRKPLLEGHRVHEFLTLVCGESHDAPPVPRLRTPDGEMTLARGGDGKPVVGLFPGANGDSRRWPAGRFSALAGRLAEREARVLVLGGPGDEPLTQVVAEAGAARGECEDLGGRTTLAELAAVLSGCDVLVTNDTGPMHFAAALGTPVVALEGPADVRQTRPLGEGVRLVGRFDLPCVPCVRNRCPRSGPGTELAEARKECMWLITVDEVERTVDELLDWGTR
jgi:lipopolysaccharide heptosyltransferase II